jgi:hypothetical protein
MPKKELKNIGGLWLHKDKNDDVFFSGVIDFFDQEGTQIVFPKEGKLSVMIFKNKFKKKGTNQPSYRVFLAEDGFGEEADREVF